MPWLYSGGLGALELRESQFQDFGDHIAEGAAHGFYLPELGTVMKVIRPRCLETRPCPTFGQGCIWYSSILLDAVLELPSFYRTQRLDGQSDLASDWYLTWRHDEKN